MFETLKSLFFDIYSLFTIVSVLDILIMTFIIYKIIEYAQGTQAMRVVKGLLVVVIITQLSDWLGLTTVNYVLKNIMTVGFIAIIIVFQPELRRALYKLGGTKLSRDLLGTFFKKDQNKQYDKAIDEIIAAAVDGARTKTGMLIVLERGTKLDDIVETGVYLDSETTKALLVNIFVPKTPLHDGAVVIDTDTMRIRAAACLLPLTQNRNLNSELGTRHRSAIGISEVSDCISIVVSEETGTISYCSEGRIIRYLTPAALKSALSELLNASVPEEKKEEALG